MNKGHDRDQQALQDEHHAGPENHVVLLNLHRNLMMLAKTAVIAMIAPTFHLIRRASNCESFASTSLNFWVIRNSNRVRSAFVENFSALSMLNTDSAAFCARSL